MLADRPVIVFGKWRGTPRGTVTIRGISGSGEYLDTLDVSASKPSQANSGLRYLWARHRIAMLSDYNLLAPDDKRIKEVTNLGLAYNLLTNYTSFVAVDSEIRNKDGKTTTVKQPLPLPEGVSDYAVGSGYLAAALTPLPGTPVWHDARAKGLVAHDMDWDLLNISFELDWQRVILVSETVAREELHRMYQRLRRLRLLKYAKAIATHPFQMDLPEYGRAKAIEWAYRVKSAFSARGGTINAGLKKAS